MNNDQILAFASFAYNRGHNDAGFKDAEALAKWAELSGQPSSTEGDHNALCSSNWKSANGACNCADQVQPVAAQPAPNLTPGSSFMVDMDSACRHAEAFGNGSIATNLIRDLVLRHSAALPPAQPESKDAERYRHQQRKAYQDYLIACPQHGLKPLSFEEYKAKYDAIGDAAIEASKSKEGSQ